MPWDKTEGWQRFVRAHFYTSVAKESTFLVYTMGSTLQLNFGNPEKLNSEGVYDPDLNDGVVLALTPLWELVPGKEAKSYWEELVKGQYEWSSIGKLLRKKRLEI